MYFTGEATIEDKKTRENVREANIGDILYRPILDTFLINEKEPVIEQIILSFQEERLCLFYPT